jgi:beta-glucosidase
MHSAIRLSLAGAVAVVLGVVVGRTVVRHVSTSSTNSAEAPAPGTYPFQDLALGFDARAKDLVSRMTLDEKIGQLMNDAPAIPRLGVPAYNWWNESLHGVARAGRATVFPQAIGMAASFDTELLTRVATVIGDEGRAKHHEYVRQGDRGIYRGLTFWSPNVNIFRDPRWGRGQETYGEDPYLTARMGVAYVKALQGDDPTYWKTVATAKHYLVHSGPEADRHTFDVSPSERDLHETYLPAFKALVQEAKVASVMGAYNRVNGESASASPRFLGQILRRDWGFDGYVVSDCGSIDDIFGGHKIVKTAEEAAALAVKEGCDLECGTIYKSLKVAVDKKLITEAQIDVALTRLMFARFKLGMFDPPEKVKYAQVPFSVNEAAAHDQLAREMAQASIVLLKNTGVLPLSGNTKKVAVVGPNADEIMTLLGNYYGTPSRPVTVVQGIRNALPGAEVSYARGVDLVENRQDPRAVPPIPPQYLRPAAGASEQGLKAEYFRGKELQGAPVVTRIDRAVNFRWDRLNPTTELVQQGQLTREQGLQNDAFSARWTGQLVPPVTGRYEITVTGDDGFRLDVAGTRVLDEWTPTPRARARSAMLDFEAGKAYDVKLEYFENIRDAEVRLNWREPGAKDSYQEALDAAKAADVVIFAGGLNGEVEGEEMPVKYPGFAGGDRTEIALPKTQQRLLEELHRTGKPVVLVLMTGSALAVEWAKANLPAVLVAWYPGQQGGNAIADVLFGKTNPSGRLPVTFYKSVNDLPPFADYAMANRTYKYFTGEPLFAFGHGLSYTTFRYSGIRVEPVAGADAYDVSFDVQNTGARAGHEVPQLYVRALAAGRPMPLRELRGFTRIELAAGATGRVSFRLKKDDLAYYDEGQKRFVVAPGEYEVAGGASSADLRVTARLRVP